MEDHRPPPQDISPDMREFIALLLKHRVRFALCGGFAVTYYGFIRIDYDELTRLATE